jgi:transposase
VSPLFKKKDPAAYEAGRANIDALKSAALAGAIRLLFLDEAGFSTVPPIQRAWSPVGQPHCAEAGEPRGRVNALGALDWATQTLHYDLIEGGVKRPNVAAFIDRLATGSQVPLTVVVLDNATIHHGFDREDLLRWQTEHRLVFVHLPPYSPELNPIEIVWRAAKYQGRKFKTWLKENLIEEVKTLLDGFGQHYRINFA